MISNDGLFKKKKKFKDCQILINFFDVFSFAFDLTMFWPNKFHLIRDLFATKNDDKNWMLWLWQKKITRKEAFFWRAQRVRKKWPKSSLVILFSSLTIVLWRRKRMYKGNPTAFHFSRIFCIWDDNTTVEVSVAMAVAAFYSQDAESRQKEIHNEEWKM